VKQLEKHMSRLLVSIAVLLVFGNVAFASEGFSEKSKSTVVAEFQKADQKPIVFDEISLGEVSQTISQNEYFGFGTFGMFNSSQDFSFSQVSSLFHSSYALKDKRELIFRHLFPFHFFW
jgi:hypothetical protein